MKDVGDIICIILILTTVASWFCIMAYELDIDLMGKSSEVPNSSIQGHDQMNPKWLKLAADMLETASDQFSNHGCNDWDFPNDWTLEERQGFIKAMYADNGTPEECNLDHLHVPDWWAMSFLASCLKKHAGQ